MDLVSFLSGIINTSNIYSTVCLALFVWLLVNYLPKRDEKQSTLIESQNKHFFEVLESYKLILEDFRKSLEDFKKAEDIEHKEIIRMINEHDKHALEGNMKLAEILRRIESCER